MNKLLMWVIVGITALFLLLLIFGNYAEKKVAEGIENNQNKREKTEVKDEQGKEPLFYGNRDGEKMLLDDGVSMWVGDIAHGRFEGMAVVKLSVVNKLDTEYKLNLRNMYIEDADGVQYPSYRYKVEDEDLEVRIQKNTVYEGTEAFVVDEEYEGEFDGWMLVYEGKDGIKKFNFESEKEDSGVDGEVKMKNGN